MKKTVTEFGPNLTIEETDTYIKYHTGDGTITHHKPKSAFLMRWIDVNDKLPAEGGRYWCYCIETHDLGTSGFQWNCYYDDKDKEWRDNHKTITVTHWMPLPEPPVK